MSHLLGHSFTRAYTGSLQPFHPPLAHLPLYHLESFLSRDVISGICLPLDVGSAGVQMRSVCPPLDPKAWPARSKELSREVNTAMSFIF